MNDGVVYYYSSKESLLEYIHVEDAVRLSKDRLKPEYKNQHIILADTEKMKALHHLIRIVENVTNDLNGSRGVWRNISWILRQ